MIPRVKHRLAIALLLIHTYFVLWMYWHLKDFDSRTGSAMEIVLFFIVDFPSALLILLVPGPRNATDQGEMFFIHSFFLFVGGFQWYWIGRGLSKLGRAVFKIIDQ